MIAIFTAQLEFPEFLGKWKTPTAASHTASRIGHYQKNRNTLCLPLQLLHKHCFILSWDHCTSQEKLETILMQNFGGTNKDYDIFDRGK